MKLPQLRKYSLGIFISFLIGFGFFGGEWRDRFNLTNKEWEISDRIACWSFCISCFFTIIGSAAALMSFVLYLAHQ